VLFCLHTLGTPRLIRVAGYLGFQGGGAGKRFKIHGFLWQAGKVHFLGIDRFMGY
jgi:hypothetical protein